MLYENRKKMLMNIEKRIFNIFEGKLKNKQGCLLKHTVRQNSILVLKFNFRKTLKKQGTWFFEPILNKDFEYKNKNYGISNFCYENCQNFLK